MPLLTVGTGPARGHAVVVSRLVVIAVVLGSLGGVAVAKPERPDSFVFVAGHLGVDTPIGIGGGELGVGMGWFRASVSTGLGLRGPLVAGMARAVLDVRGLDIGIGVGISRGPGMRTNHERHWYDDQDVPSWDVQYASGTVWNDLELSAELPLQNGVFVRAYLGTTRAILTDCESIEGTGDPMGCSEGQRDALAAVEFLPYLGVSAGWKLF